VLARLTDRQTDPGSSPSLFVNLHARWGWGSGRIDVSPISSGPHAFLREITHAIHALEDWGLVRLLQTLLTLAGSIDPCRSMSRSPC
jgi:hypothetical protein